MIPKPRISALSIPGLASAAPQRCYPKAYIIFYKISGKQYGDQDSYSRIGEVLVTPGIGGDVLGQKFTWMVNKVFQDNCSKSAQ